MNAEVSLFVIFVEAIKLLLLCNLHDCTFKSYYVLHFCDVYELSRPS